jgi:hypothetical protein
MFAPLELTAIGLDAALARISSSYGRLLLHRHIAKASIEGGDLTEKASGSFLGSRQTTAYSHPASLPPNAFTKELNKSGSK